MRASAVSRPTRVARMTNVPVVLSVAPMTSSPGPLPAGIGSPVSSASSTADDPSTTRPSTGTLSPGRTRSRSPTTTESSGTSSSSSPRTMRAETGRSAASRRMAPVVWPFARASSQRPSRTSPMMIAALSKYVAGSRPASSTTDGDERQDDAVGPGRARADRDERVHVARAVACRPPGRPVEAATGPDLDEGRGHDREQVALGHRGELGRGGHEGHDRERDRRSRRRPGRGAGATRRRAATSSAVRSSASDAGGRGVGRAGRARIS